MASKRDPIAKLYEERRTHPRNQPHDRFPSPHRAANKCEPHEEVQENQFRENAHGPGYANDHPNDWVRGRGESATGKPSFDFKGAWRTERHYGMADQIKDRSADHNRHWTEFERSHNAGRTAMPEAHNFSQRHVPSYERRNELGFKDSTPEHVKGFPHYNPKRK